MDPVTHRLRHGIVQWVCHQPALALSVCQHLTIAAGLGRPGTGQANKGRT
jgi:hypothetical protein